jgi:hypothetical protein
MAKAKRLRDYFLGAPIGEPAIDDLEQTPITAASIVNELPQDFNWGPPAVSREPIQVMPFDNTTQQFNMARIRPMEYRAQSMYGLSSSSQTYARSSGKTYTMQTRTSDFSIEETARIQQIINEINQWSGQIFLAGSRFMRRIYVANINTDWDYNISINDDPSRKGVDTELSKYILSNFNWDTANSYSGDQMFVNLFKHREFPHITIISRYDFRLYERVFRSIPYAYWERYLWKSSPHVKLLSENERSDWKDRLNATFNAFYAVARIPDLEELM